MTLSNEQDEKIESKEVSKRSAFTIMKQLVAFVLIFGTFFYVQYHRMVRKTEIPAEFIFAKLNVTHSTETPSAFINTGNPKLENIQDPKETLEFQRVLVISELARVKIYHWEYMLGNSWKHLKKYVQNLSGQERKSIKVQPDLFIACAEGACEHVQDECTKLVFENISAVKTPRNGLALQCYYTLVPEDVDLGYRFLHSLNFMNQEPFVSIVDLNVYEAFLRTDQDAVLLPGLLHSAPTTTDDGWIGDGFYGNEATNHIIKNFTGEYMPWLDQRLIRINFPSMQSTTYIHKSKIKPFSKILVNATHMILDKGFTKHYCTNVITSIPEVRRIREREKKKIICKWSLWHKGVASLYGTRIAVMHTLNRPLVIAELDNIKLSRQSIDSAITVHLLMEKHEPNIKTWMKDPSGFCDKDKEVDKNAALKTVTASKGYSSSVSDMASILSGQVSPNKDCTTYLASLLLDAFREKCLSAIV